MGRFLAYSRMAVRGQPVRVYAGSKHMDDDAPHVRMPRLASPGARRSRVEACLAQRERLQTPYKAALQRSLDLNPAGLSPRRVRKPTASASAPQLLVLAGAGAPAPLALPLPPPPPPPPLPQPPGPPPPQLRLTPQPLLPRITSMGSFATANPSSGSHARSSPPRSPRSKRLAAQRRRRCKEAVRAGASLRDQQRYALASQAYLSGLDRWPSDERLRRGFEGATAAMLQCERRWTRWPFGPRDGGGASGPTGGKRPSRLPPPWPGWVTAAAAAMEWEASPAAECVSGYEVEVSEVNALDGRQPWRRVCRGTPTQCTVKALGREVSGLCARVRAYNGHGRGEWSEPSAPLALRPREVAVRREIEELPAAWLHVDLAGLADFRDANEECFVAAAKEGLLRALHSHRTAIKVAFRYYALAGISSVDDDPNTMTLLQFGNFVRGAGLIDAHYIRGSDVDRIFLRAVRVLPAGPDGSGGGGGSSSGGTSTGGGGGSGTADGVLASALAATGIKLAKDWRKAKSAVHVTALLSRGANLMSQVQFVGALVRLSAARFVEDDSLSLGEKLARLVTEYVGPHVLNELQLLDDAFGATMRSRTMGAALAKHAKPLRQLFELYAALDKSTATARRTLATMNVFECHSLIEDAGVYDNDFTVTKLLSAFVTVNLEDDLYYQAEVADSSSELVYDEFEEVLVRVFHAAVWSRAQQAAETASLLDQDG